MSEHYSTEYFEKFRRQNFWQRLFLGRIDRKEPLYSYLLQLSKKQKLAPRLLDIGCGSGLFLSHAEKHFTCTGLDISKEALAIARTQAPETKFILGGFEKLIQMKSSSFDVVCWFDVLEHVLYHKEIFAQIYRLLSDEGLLAISVPNLGSIGTQLKGKKAFVFRDESHLWFQSTNEWRMHFHSQGFVTLRQWHGGLIDTPYVSWIPDILQRFVIKYPSQLAALYGVPIPSSWGEVVFLVLVKNPGMNTLHFKRQKKQKLRYDSK